jgi:hypothetical protein
MAGKGREPTAPKDGSEDPRTLSNAPRTIRMPEDDNRSEAVDTFYIYY